MNDVALVWRFLQSLRCSGPRSEIPLSEKFIHYVNHELFHPMVSPLFLVPEKSLTTADLNDLSRSLPDSQVPYFSILDLPEAYDVDAIKATAIESGWVTDLSLVVNVWVNPPSKTLDFLTPEYSVQSGPAKDAAFQSRYNIIARQAFGMEDAAAATIEKAMIRMLSGHTEAGYIVLVAHAGEDIAAAATLVSGGTAMLLGGCIKNSHRSKGLWRHLVQERQRLTVECGASIWFLATRNPRIAHKADRSCRIVTLYKSRLRAEF